MNEDLCKLILQAIQQRLGGQTLVCRVCGGTRWNSNGIVNLSIQEGPSAVLVIGGRHLPLVDVTCQVCGLTQLHNVIVLIGKEKFNEIAEQQKEARQVLQEAEEIVKQKEVKGKDGGTEETH